MCGRVIRRVEKRLGLLNEELELSVPKLRKLVTDNTAPPQPSHMILSVLELCDTTNSHSSNKHFNLASQSFSIAESLLLYLCCAETSKPNLTLLYVSAIALDMARARLQYVFGQITLPILIQFTQAIERRLRELAKLCRGEFLLKKISDLERKNVIKYIK